MSTSPVSFFHQPNLINAFQQPLITIQVTTLDKFGKEMTTIGHERFGFNSEVNLEALRSLYLRPHYVLQAEDAKATENGHTNQVKQHTKPNQKVDYQTESIFHPGTNSISYTTFTRFNPVKLLPAGERKRILVTGGAGFVGSHLVDRLMLLGHEVTVLDNFFTGSKTTVSHWVGHANFELVRHDVVEPFMIECDRTYVSPFFSYTMFHFHQDAHSPGWKHINFFF